MIEGNAANNSTWMRSVIFCFKSLTKPSITEIAILRL